MIGSEKKAEQTVMHTQTSKLPMAGGSAVKVIIRQTADVTMRRLQWTQQQFFVSLGCKDIDHINPCLPPKMAARRGRLGATSVLPVPLHIRAGRKTLPTTVRATPRGAPRGRAHDALLVW